MPPNPTKLCSLLSRLPLRAGVLPEIEIELVRTRGGYLDRERRRIGIANDLGNVGPHRLGGHAG
jgi:hypothetical protein